MPLNNVTVLDNNNTNRFIASQWIGKGIIYPEDPPDCLTEAQERAFTLPEELQTKFIPGPMTTISSLLEKKFPSRSGQIVTVKSELWFTPDTPNTMDFSLLFDRPLPPLYLLQELTKLAKQRWLDGMKSIKDPRYNNGTERFPLYALAFWTELSEAARGSKSWKNASTWLDSKSVLLSDETQQECQVILRTLGWNETIRGTHFHESAMELTRLIGSAPGSEMKEWVSVGALSLMLDCVRERLRQSDPLPKAIVASPALMSELLRKSAGTGHSGMPLADSLARQVVQDGIQHLYIIVHVNMCHWISVCVDFTHMTIRYGDSLTGFDPARYLNAIKKWTSRAFSKQFRIAKTGSLPHAVQQDRTSCGLYAINSIEHALFGDALLESSEVVSYRAHWFCLLANSHMQRHRRSRTLFQDILNPILELDNIVNRITPDESVDTSERSNTPMSVGNMSPLTPSIILPDDVTDILEPTSSQVSLVDLLDDMGVGTGTDRDDISMASNSELQSVDGKSQESTSSTSSKKSLKDFVRSVSPKLKSTLGKVASGWGSLLKRKGPDVPEKGGKSSKRVKKVADHEPAGTSRSAVHERETRAQIQAGTFAVIPGKFTRFKEKCLELDPHARMDEQDPSRVWCSRCGEWRNVYMAYSFYNFKRHRTHCKGTGRTLTLSEMSEKNDWTSKVDTGNASKTRKESVPCPGLTEKDDERIQPYHRRSRAVGGGGRSVTAIAMELFKKAYKALAEPEKEIVRDTQEAGHKWKNDHLHGRVRSTKCRGTVQVEVHQEIAAGSSASKLEPRKPCMACHSLLTDQDFVRILKKKLPPSENFIYTNKLYRDPELHAIYSKFKGLKELVEEDKETSPLIRYALGVAQGKYSDDKLLAGLVQAVILKEEKSRRGVGMQNFKWSSAYSHFLHTIEIESPRAYRTLKKYLPARTQRSFAQIRAKEPEFPMTIDARNPELTQKHLHTLGYYGPVGLGVDDTKLSPTWRIVDNKDGNGMVLLGAIGGPYHVANPEEARKVINNKSIKQATKVRLFTLQVPLPGVAPILVAALPIGESHSAEELVKHSEQLIRGLVGLGICVVSYACDGTETERKVQRLLLELADERREYTIPGPRGDQFTIVVQVAFFGDCPIVMIQDSKHGLKTLRNNLFSGARFLVFGDATALYRRIRDMAFHPESPLYERDVERVDRQDDNAATRLFSAGNLQHINDNSTDMIGEMVYLFAFGELIDAYQNRSISLSERFTLVLRTYYFLTMWKVFLEKAGYPLGRFFISREAADICRMLVEGMIGLLLVYRDFYSTPTLYPLLPWLHSTEACEHTFGCARQIVKDFTVLDFHYMIQKLRFKIREAVLLAEASNPRATASGYNHTYVVSDGIDLRSLASHIRDSDIPALTDEAMQEAESIICLLGLVPSLVQSLSSHSVMLPSISSWFSDDRDGLGLDLGDISDTENDGSDSEDEDQVEGESLQVILRDPHFEDWSRRLTTKKNNRLTSLASAAAALAINDILTVQDYPIPDVELEDEADAEEHDAIHAALTLPLLNINSEAERPLGRGTVTLDTLDVHHLVELRQLHQTHYAANGLRTRQIKNLSERTEVSAKRELVKEFHRLIKEESRTGTGLERTARWQKRPASGNAANAKVVASAAAATAVKKRIELLRKVKVPGLQYVATARVSLTRPLKIGDFGIMYTTWGSVMIGQILALYTKSGGKHCATDSITTIGAMSYAGVQLWQPMFGHTFSPAYTVLHTKLYDFTSSLYFLALLGNLSEDARGYISLPRESTNAAIWDLLRTSKPQLEHALTLSRKRKKVQDELGAIEEEIED